MNRINLRKYRSNNIYLKRRKYKYLILFILFFLTVGYSSLVTTLSLSGQIFVKVDKIAPAVEYSVLGGSYNSNQTITITPIDNESGVSYYSIFVYKDGVILNSYEDLKTESHDVVLDEVGTYEIRTFVVDKFNNEIEMEPIIDGMYYQTYLIDKEKPILTVTPTTGNYETSTNVTLTVQDTGGSELSSDNIYNYCLSESSTEATDCTWIDYTSGTAFTISGTNQTKYLWVYPVKDNADNINGNNSNIALPYIIGSYNFDTTAPTLKASATSGNYKTSGNITLTVADTGSSGLSSENNYKYYLSTSNTTQTGGSWIAYTSGTAFTISGTNQTKYLWVYPVKDNSGNVNDSKTFGTAYLIGTYKFDSTAPTLKVTTTINESSATIKLTAADTGGSGLSSSNTYKYCLSTSNSSATGCTWTAYTSGTAFTVTGTGTKYLFVYPVKDNSGNVNNSKTFGTAYSITSFTLGRLLYNEIVTQNKNNGTMVLDNKASTYVSASTGIDFAIASSATNGQGVYVRNGTESDTYPIYYYRGAVTNNNVIFGGFCWKIVRTTETGGIKLIYNGVPTDGICNNTGEASQLGTSAFNPRSNYNAYAGYMYGTPNSSTYEAEHLSTKTSTSSTIKTVIDTWYSQNMTSYTTYLEDTIWCNDRSLSSGTGAGTSETWYGGDIRIGYGADENPQPSLECTNKNDRFTVSETMDGRVNGNGALTYPVALLTADELTLAGNGYFGYSRTTFLQTGTSWWSLTPLNYNAGYTNVFLIGTSGELYFNFMYVKHGVRPSVSLKLGTLISKTGDGSANSPFVVE